VVCDADERRGYARRVPLVERLCVFVDDEGGSLRTDHAVWLGGIPVIRLHYRLEPRSDE
jgi:hypothetical protein